MNIKDLPENSINELHGECLDLNQICQDPVIMNQVDQIHKKA